MTTGRNLQQLNQPRAKILENLIDLKEYFQFSAREIAAAIGTTENHLSRISNGKRQPSEQIEKAIALLVEVNQLRKRIYDIEAAQATLHRLTSPIGAATWNEKPTPYTAKRKPKTDTPGDVGAEGEQVIAKMRVAERAKKILKAEKPK
jgi:transcriptional regulator with XRE-family HTH domain